LQGARFAVEPLPALAWSECPACRGIGARISVEYSGKTPYIRFDWNEYSIPHQFVRTTLLAEATLDTVRIVHGAKVVAQHSRSFDRDKVIEQSQHIDDLVQVKRTDSRTRGMTRINNVAPSAKKFFQLVAERGHNMGRLTQTLVYLLELYGGAELEAVLSECIANERIHSQAVRSALDQRRGARGDAPPVALRFLKDRRIDEITVQPKSLKKYDEIIRAQEDEE
jgi:hypothetical protein